MKRKQRILRFIAVSFLIMVMLLSGACNTAGINETEQPDTATPQRTAALSTESAAQTQTEDVEKTSENTPLIDHGQYMLKGQQATDDYDAIWSMLEDNYPFFDAIQKEMGIDWRAVKEEGREQLSAQIQNGWITQEAFINVIQNTLYHFKEVGHLYLFPEGFYKTLTQVCEEYADSANAGDWVYGFWQRMLDVLEGERTKQFYAYYAMFPSNGSENSVSGENAMTDDQCAAMAEESITTDRYEGTPYVCISTFYWPDTRCVQAAVDSLQNFFRENRNAENIIIDIRGNGGGSDNVWMGGIVTPLLNETVAYKELVGVKNGSNNQYLSNDFSDDSFRSVLPDSNQIRECFPEIESSDFEGLDQLFIQEQTYEPSDGQVGFRGHIWVLIDQGDFSATDAFARFCKFAGFATLVGTTTGGSGSGGQPYLFAAPNSGVLIYYEPFYGFNEDGTCNAIIGTAPDIAIDDGQDALQVCLEAINNG